MKLKKVIVGLSGGVDSAVSCLLLKQQGYDVEAIFMQNWDSYVNNEKNTNQEDKCEYQYDYDDAIKIAEHLNIKLHKVNFIDEYWNNVFSNFVNEYKKGRTPNPDILCNQYIKFGSFLDYVSENFKFDYIAMGHYARVTHAEENLLMKGLDDNKDQTYFLCNLNQKQLEKVLFPIGALLKSEVRKIAKDNKIPVWDKKDSTGICFIGKRNFNDFLSNYIQNKPGDIVDIESKVKLGKHLGISFYTIGQNNNLSLAGMEEKHFVCDKDITKNILYVVSEKLKDKYLVSHECLCKKFNWIITPKNYENLEVRFRHRQKLLKCEIKINTNDNVIISYKEGSIAVTPGQSAVLYQGDTCLGGGVIDCVNK